MKPNMDGSPSIDVWPAADIEQSIDRLEQEGIRPTVSMLDPWYNKGVGGVREDYFEYICNLLNRLCSISDHVFFWGFPEIVAQFVGHTPTSHENVVWLTWYYKNNPSVIRGWRSSQNACLHLSKSEAKLYPEHFLNQVQREKYKDGKLRYIPGPTSVIEAPLIIGFVGRDEATGHPSQKPLAVYDKLIRMTTVEGDLVFDGMAGSGTTAAICAIRNRRAIITDMEPKYVEMCRQRSTQAYPGWSERLDRINNNRDKGQPKFVFDEGFDVAAE